MTWTQTCVDRIIFNKCNNILLKNHFWFLYIWGWFHSGSQSFNFINLVLDLNFFFFLHCFNLVIADISITEFVDIEKFVYMW